MISKWMIVFLGFMAMAPNFTWAQNSQKIHLFLVQPPNPIKAKIIKREILDKAKSILGNFAHIDFVTHGELTSETLLEVIRQESTYGVIVALDPAYDKRLKPDRKEGEFPYHSVDGYLVGSDERYIPESIFSASHSQLRFLSLIVCHSKSIVPKYYKWIENRPQIELYYPPTHSLDDGSNPMFEFFSYYQGEKILSQIKQDVDSGRWGPLRPSEKRSRDWTLSIDYSDLASQRFDYEVLVNGVYVGSMIPGYRGNGKTLKPHHQVDLKVPYSLIENHIDNTLSLLIEPDDHEDRPHLEEVDADSLKLLDDILIHSISLRDSSGKVRHIQNKVFHLGDQNEDIDSSRGLRIRKDIWSQKAPPVQTQLKLEWKLERGD